MSGVTVALACLAAWATGHICLYWRSTEERLFRHRMYALRDRLRWMAIKDPRIAGSEAFGELDRMFTFSAFEANVLSPWAMLPLVLSKAGRATIVTRGREVSSKLESLHSDEVQSLLTQGHEEIYGYLRRRWPITMRLLTTFVRIVGRGEQAMTFRGVVASTVDTIDIRSGTERRAQTSSQAA